MKPEALLERFRGWASQPALLSAKGDETYAQLLNRIEVWGSVLQSCEIGPRDLFGISSDVSADSIALLLAGMDRGAVAVVVPPDSPEVSGWLSELNTKGLFLADPSGALSWDPAAPLEGDPHPLLHELGPGDGGFVIFTSGSTGRPKAVLHRASRFLEKFDHRGRAMRTLAFLLFDHIAGLDTVFYTLAAGGEVVVPTHRDPDQIGAAVEAHGVEVLPTSPTFLKLLCLSGALERHDWSSLRVVAYGSERMPENTLARVNAALPDVCLSQRYGTSEFGSPSTRSRGDDSTWLAIRGYGIEHEVREGVLWLRSESSMLGYLNAPQPFDEKGWYCTGDRVEEDGEWLRFLGRESERIQVGGEKVSPEEVVSVLLELPWVVGAEVDGMPHAIVGEVVRARLDLAPEAPVGPELRRAVRTHCRSRLAAHKVPVKVEAAGGQSEAPKKRRLAPDSPSPSKG